MNTWFVGNVPIGHRIHTFPAAYKGDGQNEKTFFMKARIMTGQADLKNNKLNLEDFMWLSKEEIAEYTGKKYFYTVEDMLVTR